MNATADREVNMILERFEQSWESGDPPEIDEFLPESDSRHQVLIELIMVDLVHRWRRNLPEADIAATLQFSSGSTHKMNVTRPPSFGGLRQPLCRAWYA